VGLIHYRSIGAKKILKRGNTNATTFAPCSLHLGQRIAVVMKCRSLRPRSDRAVTGSNRAGIRVSYPSTSAVPVEFEEKNEPQFEALISRRGAAQNLHEMEAGLAVQFLELMELRERLRQAELSADLQNKTRARGPAPVVIAAVA
jgi:hypothetical protein